MHFLTNNLSFGSEFGLSFKKIWCICELYSVVFMDGFGREMGLHVAWLTVERCCRDDLHSYMESMEMNLRWSELYDEGCWVSFGRKV